MRAGDVTETVHRLRKLDVGGSLRAHSGIVHGEAAGGWDAVLADVAEHSKEASL
jgi:hypothetical protein